MKTLIIAKDQFLASYLAVMYSLIDPDVILSVDEEIDLQQYDTVIAPFQVKNELTLVSNLLTYDSSPLQTITPKELVKRGVRLRNKEGEFIHFKIKTRRENTQSSAELRDVYFDSAKETNDKTLIASS